MRLSPTLQRMHHELQDAAADQRGRTEEAARAKRLALTLLEIGEDPTATETPSPSVALRTRHCPLRYRVGDEPPRRGRPGGRQHRRLSRGATRFRRGDGAPEQVHDVGNHAGLNVAPAVRPRQSR